MDNMIFYILLSIAFVGFMGVVIVKVVDGFKSLHDQNYDFEFQKVKNNVSNICPICYEKLDFGKTQRIINVNGKIFASCMRHNSREVTDFIKSQGGC